MRDLVLLHGWAMTPKVWETVIPELSVSHRLHNLSLPGYSLPADYRGMEGEQLLDRWSDECLAASPHGAVWVAWSLGALIALNAALRSPGVIAGLVLVSATPKFTRATDWEAGIEIEVLEGFLQGLQAGDGRVLTRFVLLQAAESDDARRLSRVLSRCVVDSLVDPGVLAAGLAVLEAVDLRQSLADVPVPVRVIHGSGDRIVPFAAGAYIAGQVPNGDLVHLETGHAPFVTRPAAFIESVRSWM